MKKKSIQIHNALCIRCQNIFQEKLIVIGRQETCLCPNCIEQLIKEHLQFNNIDLNQILYITKRYEQDHKIHYKLIQAKLNKIDIINSWIPLHMNFPRGMLELNNEQYVDLVLKEAKSVFKNFNVNAICDLFTYTLKDLNNTNIYTRKYNEVFKTLEEAQQYCDRMNEKIEFNRLRKTFKNYLYVDDIRQIPRELNNSYKCFQVLNYKEAITKLKRTKFSIIDLDHDLGEEKTGYDICKYIIENDIQFDKIRIHTSNPVGRDNMIQLLERYTNIPIEIY